MNIYARTRTIYLFWQMNVRLQRELEALLTPFNVTPGQYVAMSHLRGQHLFSAAELARKTGVSAQSTNELVMALERKKYIVRKSDVKNPRILRMELTIEGLQLLAEIDDRVDALEANLFQVVTPTEVSIMRASMIALLGSLSAPTL